jgi:hypothetical protein
MPPQRGAVRLTLHNSGLIAEGRPSYSGVAAMDTQDKSGRWVWIKPALWGLVVGLIAGPAISGYMGWQLLSSTAQNEVKTAVYDQEAKTCAMLAREHVPDPSALDYTKRRALAEQYAKLPWDQSQDYRVVDACSDALATKTVANTTPASHG